MFCFYFTSEIRTVNKWRTHMHIRGAAIVFGALGRKMGREYVAKGGRLTGAAKVGFVFCKVALILGIVTIALLALSLLINILSNN